MTLRGSLFVASVLALFVLSGCSRFPGKPGPGPEVPRPDSIVDPVVLFSQNCAGCHGADGKGKPSMANTDLVTGTKGMTEAQVEEIIAKGKAPKMPAYSSLGADTVKALAKYVKSLQ